ncbi:hypothetical protein JTB14_014979 [Gonioctena quinquepunctata]|nr:hypothetical protein JTB14_014979 [Gonioctena quinquepunctata]
MAEKIMKTFEELSSKDHSGRTNKITLEIDTGGAKPIKQRQYLMSPYLLNILNSELDNMLRLGVVEPSDSPWNRASDIAHASDSDTEVAEVSIEPPESHVLTDEDSADEDEGGLAGNLSSRQLTAGAEIRFTNSRRVGGIADDFNSDLQNEISARTSSNGYFMEENIGNMSTSHTEKTNKTELKLHKVPAHTKYCDDADLLFTEHYFPEDNYDIYIYMTHCELFELFSTDKLLQVISQQTTNNALF